MKISLLKLNDSKIEFLLIGTKHQINLTGEKKIHVSDDIIIPCTNAWNLGYFCDLEFKNVAHINKLLSVFFGTIRKIARIWHLLGMDTCKILMQSLVLSCIDYCNSLLLGTAKYRIEKLNTILHMACRAIYDKRKYDHISEELKQLHWLQVQERIEHKNAVLIYQCVHGEALEYLSNLIDMEYNHYLRSTVKKQCTPKFIILHFPLQDLGFGMPCHFMLKTHKLFNNLNLSLKPTYLVNRISLVMSAYF